MPETKAPIDTLAETLGTAHDAIDRACEAVQGIMLDDADTAARVAELREERRGVQVRMGKLKTTLDILDQREKAIKRDLDRGGNGIMRRHRLKRRRKKLIDEYNRMQNLRDKLQKLTSHIDNLIASARN